MCRAGACGVNAECYVRGNQLRCRCPEGYIGDPDIRCTAKPDNPCKPSPCGPYTQCTVGSGNKAVCSCLPGFEGRPQSSRGCTPECQVDEDCASDLACVNTRCVDPCRGACGINSYCEVHIHKPVCACPAGYIGNPYLKCEEVSEKDPPGKTTPSRPNPCIPPPCGENAECRVEGTRALCSCGTNYKGDPYVKCQPECVTNSECPSNKACINKQCKDPCPGSCGINSDCEVDNHNPICFCRRDLVGDPFTRCTKPVAPSK